MGRPAKGGRRAKADVVDEDDQDIGRALGRPGTATTLRSGGATRLWDDGPPPGVLAASSDTPLAAEVAHQLALVAPQLAAALARTAAGVPLRQAKAHLSRPSLRVAASR